MFGGVGVLHLRLQVEPPVPLSLIVDPSINAALSISTHFNDHRQSHVTEVEQAMEDGDIDFSKAEDFLQLETPIDARRDHSVLKLAYTIPACTFMSRLLRKYPINKKRLAFIQRRPVHSKTVPLSSSGVNGKQESKDISVSCQVCGQRFTRQHLFQQHILTHPDPENKIFLCQICGKRFNRADHLNRHSLLHQVSVYKCQQCGEEFDRASHLDRHRRKNHPPAGQVPSHTPPQTPKGNVPTGSFLSPNPGTQQPSGSNLHLLAAVATPESASGAQVMTPEDTIPFVNLIESDLVQPEEQVVQATQPPSEEKKEPERPFLCEVCNHRFIRATHLRRHMRIHTGEKPFTCHICGQRYARGDYLRAHIQAHRKDRIHKCKHCGEAFHDLTRFADHCRVMHRDINDEFGNPCPPPEYSPPPPAPSITLESTLAIESAEEITMIQIADIGEQHPQLMPTSTPSASYHPISIQTTPNVATSPTPDMIQMTLVNIPDPTPSPDAIITSHQPPQPHSSHFHTSHVTIPTLPSLGGHNDIIQNGQLGIPDRGHDMATMATPKPLPALYAANDPILQYIISNGNMSNGQTQRLHH